MGDYDLVVIGGGNTGLSAASRVAAAGRRVALVDRGPVGGLCSLAGCNPKKVFVRATEVLDEVRRAGVHGVAAGDAALDFAAVAARKRAFTDPVAAQTEEALRASGVERLRGEARFTAPDRLAVDGRALGAAGFVVATGSRPRPLALPGAELARTTDDVLALDRVPRRLVILGAGVVAMEFGFVFARLGAEVTVVARGDHPLKDFDADFLAPVVAHGEALGLRWRWRHAARAIRAAGAALAVDVEGPGGATTLAADFVLNATGRVADLAALDLGRAEVEADARGVRVDAYLRSRTNPRVFAGGDAHGAFQLSPVASYDGRVIARNFLGGEVQRADYALVPRAVFTTPPLALVGLTAEAARAQGRDVDATLHDMRAWKVFAIAGDDAAQARMVVDRATGRLLGAQLWSSAAPDLIHTLMLAIRHGMTRDALEDLVPVYPTATSALLHAFR